MNSLFMTFLTSILTFIDFYCT